MVPAIPAIQARNSSKKTFWAPRVSITLHVVGLAQSYIGNISGQQTSSSLACSFLSAEKPKRAATIAQGVLDSIEQSHATEIDAELNGLPTRLSVTHDAEGSAITSDATQLFVAQNGELAVLQMPQPLALECLERQRTWLFGPALILALARHRVYCLHASSIAINGRAYVLIGRSGVGKSTLAKAASQPLTDDISPIGDMELLPHFPQLKLKNEAYPNVAERYQLGGFVHVTRAESDLENLSGMDAPTLMRLLLSHTIASKLFRTDELAPHFRWCAKLAEKYQASSAVLSPAYRQNAPQTAAASALIKLTEFAQR